MPKPSIKPFDAAEMLTTPERVVSFLRAAFATGERPLILKAIGAALRALPNQSKVARGLGISRETLRSGFSEKGNPSFDTLLKVFEVLGVELTLQGLADGKPVAPKTAKASKGPKTVRTERAAA